MAFTPAARPVQPYKPDRATLTCDNLIEGHAVSDAERMPVTITVIGVEQVRGRGPLIGLAIVELDVAGVVLTLQGVQVLRLPGGSVVCRSPQFRRSNGAWASAAVLPPELAEALGTEVLAHLRNTSAPGRA